MNTITLKSYRLTSVGNNLELGKRGGLIKYDLAALRFQLYSPDKTSLSELEVADATHENSAVTLKQLNTLKSSVSPYNVANTTTLLNINERYYNTANTTLTLPDTSSLSIGDIIYIRSAKNVSQTTVNVFDDINEDIATSAGVTSQFTIDIMGEFSFIYAGGTSWEVL